MGCDIHAFVECQNEDAPESRWLSTGIELEIGRNYELFALLAGVRGYSEPIHEPKGLPKNISSEIQEKSNEWEPDGHNHSYLSLNELQTYMNDNKVGIEDFTYCDKCKKLIYESENDTLDDLYEYIIKDLEDIRDRYVGHFESGRRIRIVFWFDS